MMDGDRGSPCLGCIDRTVGCHAVCSSYIKWDDEVHVAKKAYAIELRRPITRSDYVDGGPKKRNNTAGVI